MKLKIGDTVYHKENSNFPMVVTNIRNNYVDCRWIERVPKTKRNYIKEYSFKKEYNFIKAVDLNIGLINKNTDTSYIKTNDQKTRDSIAVYRNPDKSYFIWYKDSGSDPAAIQTMTYEYELLYQASKQADSYSPLMVYIITYKELFISIVKKSWKWFKHFSRRNNV